MLEGVAAKWAFYDRLIDSVPDGPILESCVTGDYWVLMRASDGGAGLAHFLTRDSAKDSPAVKDLLGQPLRRIAALIKSWDLRLASFGLAAVNASANARLSGCGVLDGQLGQDGVSAFETYLSRAKGRKVAVIGHFPHLEPLGHVASSLSILERNPQPGDYLDSAAEFLLPLQDLVFITGTTIINKTLPRLLELSSQAAISLVGPSVPMLKDLFSYGIFSLSGTFVRDYGSMAKAVERGDSDGIFRNGGIMLNLTPEML